MVKSNDISVVVQGPIIEKITVACLKSIRKNLPNAQIILSTWVGSDVSGLDYDDLILNEDPGFVMQGLNGWQNICNINRMLKSTKVGIKKCSRDYILKIRTDFFLSKSRFLKYFDAFPLADSKYKVLNHKIIAYPIFSLRYEQADGKNMPVLFHIADTVCFGTRQDIQDLFSCNLVDEPDFSRYFDKHDKNLDRDIFPNRSWKMSPEQYIISALAKKYFPTIRFENYLDYNDSLIKFSHDFIIANFIFLDESQWGVYTLQKKMLHYFHKQMPKETRKTMYNYKNFRKYYRIATKLNKHTFLYKLCTFGFWNK